MSEPITSAEHLENLFREGKISRTDYEMLRQTLETKAREEMAARQEDVAREATAAHDVAAVAPRRLRKSWTNRWVGGICGGIADYFGLDVRLIRTAFAILASLSGFAVLLMGFGPHVPMLISNAIAILGFLSCSAVLLVYLLLYCSLPWDPSYTEHQGQVSAKIRQWLPFASTLCALWILDIAIFIYAVPDFLLTCSQAGTELPIACRIVLTFVFSPLRREGILMLPTHTLFLAGLIYGYAAIPNVALRRGYALLVCVLVLLPVIVLALTLLTLNPTEHIR